MLGIHKYFWWYLGILVVCILLLLYSGQRVETFENVCQTNWDYITSTKQAQEQVSELTKELLAAQSQSQFNSRFNKAFEANRLKISDDKGYSPHEPVQQTNAGTEPWNHHPIQSILYDPVLQYPNLYANEMNNLTFERRLQRVFEVSDDCSGKWSRTFIPDKDTPEDVLKAYTRLLTFIQDRFKSTSLFDLCADTERFKIQVVHDVWTEYQNSLADNSYKITMETILYRESKFIGKHVRFQGIVKKKRVSICQALVLGVVSEDQIALYPTVASDPADDRLWGKFPSIVLEPEPTILLNSNDIQTILQTYKTKRDDEAKAYQAISGKNINDYIVQPSSYVRPAPKYVEDLPSFLQPLQDY